MNTINITQSTVSGLSPGRILTAVGILPIFLFLSVRQQVGDKGPIQGAGKDSFYAQQLLAIQQRYSDCGLHAAVNAKSIDTCIERRQSLSTVTHHTTNFYSQGARFLPTINNLYDRDIMSVTTQCFNMDNCCVFALDHDVCFTAKQPSRECCKGVPDYSGPLLNNKSIRAMVNDLKRKSAGAVHFVCHVPNHWVLVSMIKQHGSKRPCMAYMDSLNTPLRLNKKAQEYVHALYTHYFIPLLV